jgi:hypothetical protein
VVSVVVAVGFIEAAVVGSFRRLLGCRFLEQSTFLLLSARLGARLGAGHGTRLGASFGAGHGVSAWRSAWHSVCCSVLHWVVTHS